MAAKRVVSGVLTTVLLLLVLDACGNTGSGAATTTTSHPHPSTTSTAPSYPVSMTLSHPDKGFVVSDLLMATNKVVYVVGTLWGPTGGRVELFRSDDGGGSFQQVTTPASRRPTARPTPWRCWF